MYSIILNTIQYAIDVVKNHIIVISQYGYTHRIQILGTFFIMLFHPIFLMYASIQFYAKIQVVAEKIKNIRTYRMLTTKTIPCLAFSQITP